MTKLTIHRLRLSKGIELEASAERLFLSDDDRLQDYKSVLISVYRGIVKSFFERLEKKVGRIETLKLISAHGFTENGRFKANFAEGDLDLQEWVDRNDKRYNALVVLCCNHPKPVKLHSTHAILYYPVGKVTELNLSLGKHYRIFNPRNN